MLLFTSDASLNLNLGMGAYFDNRWIIQQWNKELILEQSPSIEFLELLALVAGVLTWQNRPELINSRVEVFRNNESVKFMVNDSCSSCKQWRKLISILVENNIKYNQRLFVKHIRSKDNTLSDALSRLDFKTFWKNAPKSTLSVPDQISKQIWPIEPIWFNDYPIIDVS